MNNEDKLVHVFWTSGMDSTYRVIQLLLTTEKIVQPHYIIRSESSTAVEIDRMITIRRMICNKYPKVRSRFKPTIYVNSDLIPIDKDIEKTVADLRKVCIVTEQYELMANYCKANSIEAIDVSFIKDNHSDEKLKKYESCDGFKYFKYPIAEITKKDIFKKTKSNGYYDIFIQTSFCHRPIKKIKPCGVCGPCNDAVMAGMGFRLPFVSYVKAKLTIPLRKYYRKNYLKQDTSKFFRFIKRNFEHRF